MRYLWMYLFLQSVSAQAGFGRSYLGNSRLCHQWDCLNVKLNLTDALPPKEQYATVLRSLLPSGEWQEVVGTVVDVCYGERQRKYSNACPGQALLHCIVDQLIESCPAHSWVKEDGCAKLSSIAGVSYMFSQSRYNNLEKNLQEERRPLWFMKNYFGKKCCNLPQLFNETVMKECGFRELISYHLHDTQQYSPVGGQHDTRQSTPMPKYVDELQIVDFEDDGEQQDPLNCCDLGEFIQPAWRSECGFRMHWDGDRRLTVANDTVTTTTQAPKSLKYKDVKIVPMSCEKETCVFRKLNVVSESGFVDTGAFSKLLDNLTSSLPAWTRAKARVVTSCLRGPVSGYDAGCAINDLLGCTFDVLSENCPYVPETDICKHSNTVRDGVTCQISSSKYRPKNRRQFCGLPNLANHEVLAECGVNSLFQLEYVPQAVAKPKTNGWFSSVSCRESTESTTCLLRKMDVLNKYKFMDYFKMKQRLREFSRGEWAHYPVYKSAFQSAPLYNDSCSSTKKLLNVLDYMLMTCPVSRRKNTKQCNRFFSELTSPTDIRTKADLDKITGHLEHVYLQAVKPNEIPMKTSLKTNAFYDFGLLNTDKVPPVKLISVKPKKKTLVILPVYQRQSNPNLHINSINNDGVFRGI